MQLLSSKFSNSRSSFCFHAENTQKWVPAHILRGIFEIAEKRPIPKAVKGAVR